MFLKKYLVRVLKEAFSNIFSKSTKYFINTWTKNIIKYNKNLHLIRGTKSGLYFRSVKQAINAPSIINDGALIWSQNGLNLRSMSDSQRVRKPLNPIKLFFIY